jgi:predicted heme/steroid binding protein|mmetsp:Transcript_55043/g.123060  ORF Transcript_55043/g.123060 Transcript_55043/m.123060 type:complete len:242 (-) Transcript_55043:656-1381(-)
MSSSQREHLAPHGGAGFRSDPDEEQPDGRFQPPPLPPPPSMPSLPSPRASDLAPSQTPKSLQQPAARVSSGYPGHVCRSPPNSPSSAAPLSQWQTPQVPASPLPPPAPGGSAPQPSPRARGGAGGGAGWTATEQKAPTAGGRRPLREGRVRSSLLHGTRRYFTPQEIARHNTREDCWLVAHGRVYDVTEFVSRHPAGEFAIVRHAGTDSTSDFDFHPSKAQKMWDPYLLGYVEGSADCIIS